MSGAVATPPTASPAPFAGLSCDIVRAEPLAVHTTLAIGGPADFFARPASEAELAEALVAASAAAVPWFALGGGSNVLFDDLGFRGLVVSLAKLTWIRADAAARSVEAASGARLLEVLAATRRAGLGGFEFADGIPGTVGGALRTNAGTKLGQISDVLAAVRVMDGTGRVHEIPASSLALGYRESRLAALDAVVVSATFRLRDSGEGTSTDLESFARYRRETQPAGLRNAGSIFRNPAGDSAGRLIERAGLKGRRVGGAAFSDAHANFIVNLERATGADVRALVRLARDEVARACGVVLIPEIVLVGERGPEALS